ncbi:MULTISPECIES: tripartite tricarboxylate transporter TctB family protein [unclassified Meridianimarinicoccus]|uniref:tripartite tricarboxylate transporter TctB family protein n=1 Tax=unclassified Meridianimarinicoccus TaxID=2923344 RepID=UPI001867FB33|nr:tripartite tricarboxylate transporter TctB family protein [Fluviibacterium sp. MJW13]
MGNLGQVTIDFERSHLVFPILIGSILALLGIAILITRRDRIAASGPNWRQTFADMDKLRFFGTLVLTVLYFSLMVPVGNFWPNTGLGFLICSIPYVLATGLLFMHERPLRQVLVMLVIAVIGPSFVWWLFTEIFFLTLP